jgi:hypothetical protein
MQYTSTTRFKMKKLQPIIVTSTTSNGSRNWKMMFNNTIRWNNNNNSIAREKAVTIEAAMACPPALLLRWRPILM